MTGRIQNFAMYWRERCGGASAKPMVPQQQDLEEFLLYMEATLGRFQFIGQWISMQHKGSVPDGLKKSFKTFKTFIRLVRNGLLSVVANMQNQRGGNANMNTKSQRLLNLEQLLGCFVSSYWGDDAPPSRKIVPVFPVSGSPEPSRYGGNLH